MQCYIKIDFLRWEFVWKFNKLVTSEYIMQYYIKIDFLKGNFFWKFVNNSFGSMDMDMGAETKAIAKKLWHDMTTPVWHEYDTDTIQI